MVTYISILGANILFLTAAIYFIKNSQDRRFQITMKVGDKCNIMLDKTWQNATITALFLYSAIIEDKDRLPHSVKRSDLSPYSKINK